MSKENHVPRLERVLLDESKPEGCTSAAQLCMEEAVEHLWFCSVNIQRGASPQR